MKIMCLLLLLVADVTLANDSNHHSSLDAVEIQELMAEKSIPGLALAKIENASVSYIEVYGYANVVKEIKITPDTMFNIASISKPIMGVSLLQLVDKNRLSLDEDINNYLPFKVDNPYFENEKITLRHLATHTSSIDDYYQPTSFSKNTDSPVPLDQHLRSLLVKGGSEYGNGGHYLEYLPGTIREYSNLAAGLAGHLVKSVTDEPLSTYSQQTLFQSLEMRHTAWLLEGLEFNNIAVPYSVSDTGKFVPNPHIGNPQYPDGGVRSSIQDLAKFMVAILENKDASGNQLLSHSLYKQMLSLQLPPDISKRQRFFWSDNSMGMTGHMGSDIGAFCAFYFDPTSRDGLIILMNVDMSDDSVSVMKTVAQQVMSD